MLRRFLVILFAALMAVSLLPSAALADGHEPTVEVIASGLNNPRGVHVDGKTVYVAEAGLGGEGPCVPSPEDPEAEACLGMTASVTKVDKKGQSRVVEGLPSVAEPGGFAAGGAEDIAVKGGHILIAIGLGGTPDTRAALGPDGALLGTIVEAKLKGKHAGIPEMVADIAANEAAANPDGAQIDSNPVSLAVKGKSIWVADAGGNAVVEVGKKGAISTTAVFPTVSVPTPPFLPFPFIDMDSVPTGVVRGPDKALYVSQLTGFPFPVAGASIFKVAKDGTVSVYATGFTNIMDLAFDKHGTLYVLEIATNSLFDESGLGGLWAVYPDGTKELLLTDPLFFPGGIDVGKKGELYVSNCSVCPGFGELLRIDL